MKIIVIFILLTLAGCAHVDYKPSVNPYTALNNIVTKYNINTAPLKCEGATAANCLTLVHELNQLMLEHPSNTAILSVAAYSYYKSGRNSQAQQIVNQLLNAPNPPLNTLTLGVTLAIEQGNLAKAKQIAQYAIDVFGTHASPYLQMASIYYAQGGYVVSSNYLELAYKFGVNQSSYYYHKGLIEEATTNNHLACNYYDKAMSIDPHHKSAVARYAKLTVLGNCTS
ncbi:hypothetical protein PESP_a1952 [Pseudoalteromonas espejiana DSM 9414]|uniref:Uncharacterized protein n=1 Tax=Pseudoalteromonas espejiana TaxID=28107 RepID=A0A510XU67_9GAMM|nr:hypothetical protein [Pseudoalteromonas espejiana]ASM49991.1 hypothetical protein PESP_a1952 [Pseudoalteromonas espejiana DSM 9414]GEK54568.1 hypothetical protein PES01_14130 [Pseudoalteromonas espejiana]